MVMAKLERIRIIVMSRRNQRSETDTDIRGGINMDDALGRTTLSMGYLQCFEDKKAAFAIYMTLPLEIRTSL